MPSGIRPVEETSPQKSPEQRDEGGRLRRQAMAKAKKRPHRRGWFVLVLAIGLLQAPIVAQAVVVEWGTPLDEGVETNFGGRSLLIEELTTTWCDSCADIDPYLMGMADAHGSRIAFMSYHPDDGLDAFAPEAAQHRIERLRAVNPDLPGTPTFMVEGGVYRTGTDAWIDVKRDILDVEVARQSFTQLQFNVQLVNGSIHATISNFDGHAANGTQLTFMVLEHGKMVPEGVQNPGEATRDRVVVGTAECILGEGTVSTSIGLETAHAASSCTSDFSITFESLDSFSILLLHENAYDSIVEQDDLGTYGTVEFAYRERSSDEQWSPVVVVLVATALAGLLIVQKREQKRETVQ